MRAANLERRAENLAFVFQELLIVGERLRSNRQVVNDANTFRQQVRDAMKVADTEARKRGYDAEDIQMAVFAVVAFLDESILNLRSPVFADWPRCPLQEEMFGHHIAGEVFFQNVKQLMGKQDSQDLADVLEVYHLCMLLGFAGRYSLGGRGELQSTMHAVGDKIRRIRQLPAEISPMWALPNDQIQVSTSDPWIKRLMIASIACVVLTILLFVIYKVSLGSGASGLEALAQGRA
jgi:type VI secretion system protein ImpK